MSSSIRLKEENHDQQVPDRLQEPAAQKVRTLLTLVGIALSSWVLVSLLGFNRGYEAALNKDIDNMGFSSWSWPRDAPMRRPP